MFGLLLEEALPAHLTACFKNDFGRPGQETLLGRCPSLGVPFEKVVVALLAYRILYYFLPFGVSLVLCGKLLRDAGSASKLHDTALP